MKLSSIICLLTAASTSLAATETVSYDQGYDQAGRAMTAVACSDGANGLITKYGYQTQGAIPTFPRIGGSGTISGWNDPQCGTCYKVTYKGRSIFVLGIDRAAAGINMSLKAMNTLTGGQAVALGRVNADVVKVGVGKCGLTPKRDLREMDLREMEFTA